MKARLLIVDDEQDIRQMLARHFKYLGYEVELACNGSEALTVLGEKKIDVVVTDIKMPVMDGIELLRSIRGNYSMVHTIVVTGYVTLENAMSCMRLGADTCIFKPLEDMTELEKAVESAVKNLNHWQQKFLTLQTMKT